MTVTQRRTAFVFATLLFTATSRGESFSKTCLALEGLVQNSACRLTECRMAGATKVRIGEKAQIETQGDLILLDHVCSAKATVGRMMSEQVRQLQQQGYKVEGDPRIEANSAMIVVKKDSRWLELTALVLEGEPNFSVRSITSEPEPIEVANSNVSAIPVVPRMAVSAGTAARVEQRSPVSRSTPATGAGAPPVLPSGMSALADNARVELELMIDEKGQMQKVLATRGDSRLLPAALHAIKSWSFEPALEAGTPVASALAVTLDFQPFERHNGTK